MFGQKCFEKLSDPEQQRKKWNLNVTLIQKILVSSCNCSKLKRTHQKFKLLTITRSSRSIVKKNLPKSILISITCSNRKSWNVEIWSI